MTRYQWRHAAVLVGLVPLCAACFATTPVRAPGRLPLGARVEFDLTPAGTDALAGVLGPQVDRAEGQLEAARSDSLVVRMLRTTRHDGQEAGWQRQRVTMAPRSLRSPAPDRRAQWPHSTREEWR